MLGSARLLILMVIFCFGVVGVAHAENRVLAEMRFAAHNGAEKNAGVWIDGQYVGYVKELKGKKRILLLPGKHDVLIRQAWYSDYVEDVLLEPGEVHTINISLFKDRRRPSKDATGELKISAMPVRAAVFVDDQFAGHVDEFDGHRAMLLTPGQHRVRVALPGYLPFETVVNLLPHQKLKIQTALVKGSITQAGSQISQNQ